MKEVLLLVRYNPDKFIVEMVKSAIKESGGYCPCQIKVKCPCDKFKAIEKGFCHCELYEKV